jgi:leucyl aminopeptidase
MQVQISRESAEKIDASTLVVVAFESDASNTSSKIEGSAGAVDAAASGMLAELMAAEAISTKFGKSHLLYKVPGVAAQSVLVLGGGLKSKFDQGAAYRLAGIAAKRLADKQRKSIVLDFGKQDAAVAAAAVAGSINGGIGQDLFRAEKSLLTAESIVWLNVEQASADRGQSLGDAMLLTRELVNLPANYMYPVEFVRRAASVAVTSGLELEVWDELRLRREGCGSLLAVSAGSTRAPRLLILRYAGKKKQAPLALVGKGVTFDSGGLSIKPSEGMMTMKCDMAGAATVLGAMQAIAELGVETPVVGLVGLVENMISGSSFKLGDVLTSRSGKTIEIHNTDAEGRLVLADVLNVALDEKPAQIIDLATLTGACVVALGLDIAGLMTNNQALQTQLQSAATTAGEEVWPLPMNEFFSEQIRSKVADIKNLGEGRWGGAITAAKFLEEFVGETPWVHVDIAGPAFADSPKPHIDAGASAVMVRTLVEFAEGL